MLPSLSFPICEMGKNVPHSRLMGELVSLFASGQG